MKKLYGKRKVYPSPSPMPTPPSTIANHLSLIPATILGLVAALSLKEKEVLAYLISCCSSSFSSATTSSNLSGHRKATRNRSIDVYGHEPTFECNCFRCYMSFWARWDASPNHRLIHEIIEAYEEGLFQEKKQVRKNKKGRRKRDHFNNSKQGNGHESSGLVSVNLNNDILEFVESNIHDEENQKEVEFEPEKGSIRKIASFIGGSIWGVWNGY